MAKTPVMVLQELTTKRGFAPPDYQIINSFSGTHVNRFDFIVNVAGVQGKGTGSSKQISKHQAAHNALMQLQEIGIYNPSENPVSEFNNSPFKSSPNSIADLSNICTEHKIPYPMYKEISSVGPPHAKEFTWECRISSIKTEAKANTKKMAKQLAAKEMLERVMDVMPQLAEQNTNNAITETDSQAVKMYSEFEGVVPNKSITVEDITSTIPNLMVQKDLTYSDFNQYLSEKSEANLKEMLNKLELKYEFTLIQDNPILVALSINTDTGFSTIGMGTTEVRAKHSALEQAFAILDTFMQKPAKCEQN